MFETRYINLTPAKFCDAVRKTAELHFCQPHGRSVVRVSTQEEQQLMEANQRFSITKSFVRKSLQQSLNLFRVTRTELRFKFVELIEQVGRASYLFHLRSANKL